MLGTAFGCDLIELLHEGDRSTIYRASRRGGAPCNVVLKMCARRDRERVQLLQHEWAMLQQLRQLDGVVRARALEEEGDQWGLVLEDSQALSLDRLLLRRTLSLPDVLRLAVGIAEALDALHGARVIHADLNPSNIISSGGFKSGSLSSGSFSSGSGERVTLIDFASATTWEGANERARRTGPLTYISPEQTGRLNRRIDHTTDFYSLGVILYELLAGKAPFSECGPLEILHAHVARQPPSLADVKPPLPATVVRIVLKLLAKDAENRYQSASGLRHDLVRCLEAAGSADAAMPFEIAAFDRPAQFRLPRGLYGRGADITRMTACFDAAAQSGARVLCVSGEAGVGKSAAVGLLAAHVANAHGLFASGKFQQQGSSLPYAAFSQVLAELTRQVLAETTERLAQIRLSLLGALSNSSVVLTELCPSLELVLGSRTPAPRLSAMEARTRLRHAISIFLSALATPERALCISLDDLHWADADSSSLLKDVVVSSRSLPLLVIVSHRDGERQSDVQAGKRSPLSAIDSMLEAGIPVERLALRPLSEPDVEALIRDAVSADAAQIAELASLVVARTGGNAFFLRSFLESLSSDGLIVPAPDGWRVDLARARRKGITDNIVDLLVDRIRRLPLATQSLLQLAACLGNHFDVGTLATVSERSVRADLVPAIAAELVLPLQAPSAVSEPGKPEEPSEYHFTHDRVRQAAVSMLEPATRRALHLQAGRRLLGASPAELPKRRLFEVVAQLNQASELLGDSERVQLAELNLRAAQAALHGAAGAEALQLARTGLTVSSAGWQSDRYELTRDLHLTAAEAAFSIADHDALEALSRATLANVRTPLEAIKIRTLQGLVCYGTLRFGEAMSIYLEALADLGIVIPRQPTPEHVIDEQRLTAEALSGKRVTDLRDLPTCEDPQVRASAELLSKVILLGGAMTDRIMPIAACRLVRLSIERGNTAESANAYTFYGQSLSLDHDLDRAYQFGRLALDVCHRFEDRAVRSQTYIYAYYQLMHWKAPFAELVEGLRTALDYGLEAASPFNAACSAMTLCLARFWSGEPLSTLLDDFSECRRIVIRFRQDLVLNWHEIWHQLASNLCLDPAAPTELAGPIYDEKVRLPSHHSAQDGSALFNYKVAKAFICYLLGDDESALQCVNDLQPLRELFATGLWAFPLAFIDSLCRLAACARADEADREALMAQVERTLDKMGAWLPHNPGILEHKVLLLQAEVAATRGDTSRARPLFSDAVRLAAAAGITQEEALACELAARCSIGAGDRDAARSYLRAAHRAYLKWGAITKVRALEREYPGLLPRMTTGSVDVLAMVGRDNEFDPLDLVAMIDAGQVISSEIKLDRLLPRLLQLLMESGGAQSVCLLMQRNDEWVIEAAQCSERGPITLLESLPITDPKVESLGVIPSVINYVARSGEVVLLDDAAESPLFGQDAKATLHAPCSLSCFGLKRQGKTLAVAYLVNRLARAAFTPKGQRLLEALSTQAVTSLENAVLYEQLEQKVASRTRELVQKNEELTNALVSLTEMREQLVTQEKLAALGALTAGIAHEIRNPLNFVTNFALVSATLVEEVRAQLAADRRSPRGFSSVEVERLLDDLGHAVRKINEHGSRAGNILTSMALHARESGGPRQHAELNDVLAHSIQLAYETRRTGTEHISLQTEFDGAVSSVELVVEDISRVFVNIINNAFYSVEQKRSKLGPSYVPLVSLRTRDLGQRVEVKIRDNGTGISARSKDKIFSPFFTTKPPRDGTGLGLSISHDIVVRAHGGELRVDSVEGEYAEFILVLPRRHRLAANRAKLG